MDRRNGHEQCFVPRVVVAIVQLVWARWFAGKQCQGFICDQAAHLATLIAEAVCSVYISPDDLANSGDGRQPGPRSNLLCRKMGACSGGLGHLHIQIVGFKALKQIVTRMQQQEPAACVKGSSAVAPLKLGHGSEALLPKPFCGAGASTSSWRST